MIPHLLLFALVTSAPGPQASPNRDPGGACRMLADDEIRAVQGAPVVDRKASETTATGLHVAQCVYTASDFPRSVSLTLLTGDTRTYWEATFHKRPPAEVPAAAGGAVRTSKKSPPRPVPGHGDGAFWTGDDRAGALYVLAGGSILRISVGGVSDEAERIRRSEALAQHALRRLR